MIVHPREIVSSCPPPENSPKIASLIKANLPVKSLGTEALTALNTMINDDELQQADIAALLEPIGEHITSVLSLPESCMANRSRSAVLTNLQTLAFVTTTGGSCRDHDRRILSLNTAVLGPHHPLCQTNQQYSLV